MLDLLRASRLSAAAFLATASFAPAVAQEANDTLTVVYIGDFWLAEATEVYVEKLRSEFGVDVFFTQRNSGFVPYASKMLQSGAWDIVEDAEVVIVAIAVANDQPGYCTGPGGDRPIRWSSDELSPMIEEFLQSLAKVTDQDSQTVLIANESIRAADPELWKEQGVMGECIETLRHINEIWASGAESHGFTVIDYFGSWNGPDGTVQPPRGYYQQDGRALTAEGGEAAAKLLFEAGYRPE